MELQTKTLYEASCSCIVYIFDQREPNGTVMKPQDYKGHQMFRGKFIDTCDKHKTKRTEWNKWRGNGVWYKKIHGKKEIEESEDFNLIKEVKGT